MQNWLIIPSRRKIKFCSGKDERKILSAGKLYFFCGRIFTPMIIDYFFIEQKGKGFPGLLQAEIRSGIDGNQKKIPPAMGV